MKQHSKVLSIIVHFVACITLSALLLVSINVADANDDSKFQHFLLYSNHLNSLVFNNITNTDFLTEEKICGIFVGLASTATSIDSNKFIWAKAYGGVNDDWANSIQQTSDGGYIVGGYTASFGSGKKDFLIMKVNSDGSLFWSEAFGGANDDLVTSAQQTSDGGYIVGGYTMSFGSGNSDILIMKLTKDGSLSWAKTFGGTDDDWATSIQQTSDGGYIIAGGTNSFGAQKTDVIIVKIDSNGSLSWAKTFGGANDDLVTSAQQTSDGGYIVGGYTMSFGSGGSDLLIMKLTKDGSLSWAKTFGGANDDLVTSAQQTSDGGYIVGGYTMSFGSGGSDFFFLKLSESGSLSWAKTYGGIKDDWAAYIQQTSDGGYIVGGGTYSFIKGTEKDILLLKTDSNGDLPKTNSTNLSKLTNVSVSLINPSVKSFNISVKTISPFASSLTISFELKNLQVITIDEVINAPSPPVGLNAKLVNNTVVLTWTKSVQGIYPIKGYAIYRGSSSGKEDQVPIGIVDSEITSYIDNNIDLSKNITYFYFVKSFDNQNPPNYSEQSDEVSVNVISKTIVIVLQINNPTMTVNGKPFEIDPGRGTKPIIKNNRTLVPIRAVIEALGGDITWIPVNNGIAVTIKLSSKVINLQTGKPTATVNGKVVYLSLIHI